MAEISPTPKELFFSRSDTTDPRLGDLIQPIESVDSLLTLATNLKTSENKLAPYAIFSYGDDEGIVLNSGRAGARLGPREVKRVFLNMTPTSSTRKIFDLGEINIDLNLGTGRRSSDVNQSNLVSRHKLAYDTVKKVLEAGIHPLTLGGGHDYGFSDFSSFCDYALSFDKIPVVINFDAHLDVRPDQGGPHSGTSFFRLLEKYRNQIKFLEFGIQEWCNSQQHLKWAKDRGALIYTFDEYLHSNESLATYVMNRVSPFLDSKHMLGVSFDMDCMNAAAAPGASQVFPVGMTANEVLKLAQVLMPKVHQLGIYECSPPFDHDNMSAKMAAILMHQFVYRKL